MTYQVTVQNAQKHEITLTFLRLSFFYMRDQREEVNLNGEEKDAIRLGFGFLIIGQMLDDHQLQGML